MALVAYDNSDSSEFEDEDNENTTPVVTLNRKVEEPSVSTITENGIDENTPSLFNLLPKPTNKKPAVTEEEDDEFLHKREAVTNSVKPKAKITVPSLSDFKDVGDNTPNVKPKISNGKKSGLLSMLPQPKNSVTATTKSLIPHVLTQKPNNPTVKKKETLPSPVKKAKAEPTKKLAIDYSDDSDNDEQVQNDFFSINKPVDVPDDNVPLDIDEKLSKEPENLGVLRNQNEPRNIESYFKQNSDDNHMEIQAEHATVNVESAEYYNNAATSSSRSDSYEVPQTSTGEAVLDDEAILKLCGSRGKRKREDIQIVDVNQQEVLADARDWLLKGLMEDTSKRVSASKKRGNEPTSQQRRKHQITYLAHQAKANEIELQNQWANNRMSKRQTQSKYGF